MDFEIAWQQAAEHSKMTEKNQYMRTGEKV